MAETPIGPGSVLAGRFTLDDLLDDTDGARFWRATDETLARSVAVHVIAESDARADALLTAARTSALVTDGHLLRVLDAAAEDGVVYVVNEWGSGVSLDEMLAEGPLPPRRAAWVVKEVAEAIATAHRNGVAHGRLLPEKVMVTEAGSVKLIGFVVDAVLQDRAGRDQRRVTGGAVLSAHESDVVNLAALLYAALVGRWPGTEGSTVPAAPAEHGRPLRPRQVRAGVPRPLDAICERVLNAGPHTHAVPIETAHEIYAALSDYIGDPSGAPQYEQTSLLDLDSAELDGEDYGPATELHTATPWTDPSLTQGTDTGDLAATGAFPAPTGSDDDDRTQAGVPVFHDETSGSRGLGGFSGWSDPEPTRRTPGTAGGPARAPRAAALRGRPGPAAHPRRPPGRRLRRPHRHRLVGRARHRHPLARHRHGQRPGAPGLGARRRRRRRPRRPGDRQLGHRQARHELAAARGGPRGGPGAGRRRGPRLQPRPRLGRRRDRLRGDQHLAVRLVVRAARARRSRSPGSPTSTRRATRPRRTPTWRRSPPTASSPRPGARAPTTTSSRSSRTASACSSTWASRPRSARSG